LNDFYQALGKLFINNHFCNTVSEITSQMSDLDFIFVSTDSRYVTNITLKHNDREKTVPTPSKKISDLSGYVLKKILNMAHLNDIPVLEQNHILVNSYIQMAKNIMPFAGRFVPNAGWSPFKKTNFIGVNEPFTSLSTAIDNTKFIGYRQTGNMIKYLPILLNRIKQGYLDYSKFINKLEKWNIANTFGECLDLVIGDIINELYLHKYQNYNDKTNGSPYGLYYTVKNLLDELDVILASPADDKTAKRVKRKFFLKSIKTLPKINVLFNCIAQEIQHSPVDTSVFRKFDEYIAQSAEAQSAEAQRKKAQSAEAQSAEAQRKKAQSAEAQSAEAQRKKAQKGKNAETRKNKFEKKDVVAKAAKVSAKDAKATAKDAKVIAKDAKVVIVPRKSRKSG